VSTSNTENFHIRIREELDRLGLSLAEASRRAGEKSGQRLRDVVSAKQRCPIDLLAALHGLGMDVAYVVAGGHAVSVGSEEEAKLLEAFRRTPQVVQQVVMAALAAGAGDTATESNPTHEVVQALPGEKELTLQEREALERKAGIQHRTPSSRQRQREGK
jgi:hypothetical protein